MDDGDGRTLFEQDDPLKPGQDPLSHLAVSLGIALPRFAGRPVAVLAEAIAYHWEGGAPSLGEEIDAADHAFLADVEAYLEFWERHDERVFGRKREN